MIKVEMNDGSIHLINPAHIVRVTNDGRTMDIFCVNTSFFFKLTEEDWGNGLSPARWNLLWEELSK
jgi:hypothetical protein